MDKVALTGLIFATISPFIWALTNIVDKFILSKRVKNPLGFSIVAGIVNVLIGIIFGLFLSWKEIPIFNLAYPALAGLLLGGEMIFYYITIEKEDISHTVGLMYLYPLIVAGLSFLFLNERISIQGYIGMSLVLLGTIIMSVNINSIKLKTSIWTIINMILFLAAYEFFTKIATIELPELNAISINTIFTGIALTIGVFNKNIRKKFKYEIKNFKFAIINEAITFMAVFSLYFAMAKLPATVVSSIAAIQPLFVLILERAVFHNIEGMVREKSFLSKLLPILLIVAGVTLLYVSEITNLF